MTTAIIFVFALNWLSLSIHQIDSSEDFLQNIQFKQSCLSYLYIYIFFLQKDNRHGIYDLKLDDIASCF